MNNETTAKEYAIYAHGNQKYGDRPFSSHLEDVVRTLKKFGYSDDTLLSAAWLHDTVEDCDVLITDIELKFGKEIAALVWMVTNESGGNRKERQLKTYKKTAMNEHAIVLKLADRISNTEASIRDKDKLYKMYLKEWPCFQASLRIAGHAEPMWSFLENLYVEYNKSLD